MKILTANYVLNTFAKRGRLGFTLIELIVVVSILAILGTIAFVSFLGFSASARDGSRIADLSNITKALEVSQVKTGYYPDPSSSTGVTFSGWIVWTQWTVGDSVIRIINSAGFSLSRVPTDPLYVDVEYTYSLTSNKREYQLGAIIENSDMAYNPATIPFVTQAYAEDAVTAYVKGNYNGVMSQVKTGSNQVCILAVPSIMLRDISSASWSVLNSWDPLQMNNLIFHKKSNLPSSYAKKGVSSVNSFPFIPLSRGDDMIVGWSGIVSYCSGSLPTSASEVFLVMDNLSATYVFAGLDVDSVSTPRIPSLLNSTINEDIRASNIATLLASSFGWLPVHIEMSNETEVCNYNQSDLDALNTLWDASSLEMYTMGGENPLVLPLTKEQWCTVNELYWFGWSAIPSEIFTLNRLRILNLDGNSLLSLPPEIDNLTNLTELSLSNNSITALPMEIKALTELRKLIWSDNKLAMFPEDVFSLVHLLELDLQSNNFMTLPPEIVNLTNLTWLNLDNNNGLGGLSSGFNVSQGSWCAMSQEWIPTEWDTTYIYWDNSNIRIYINPASPPYVCEM